MEFNSPMRGPDQVHDCPQPYVRGFFVIPPVAVLSVPFGHVVCGVGRLLTPSHGCSLLGIDIRNPAQTAPGSNILGWNSQGGNDLQTELTKTSGEAK